MKTAPAAPKGMTSIKDLFERPPTQQEVARAIGVDPSVINRWINGTAIPNGLYLQRLCAYFGVPEAQIDFSQYEAHRNGRKRANKK
jgi:transcriptional regulator with XRE-family HTH domain